MYQLKLVYDFHNNRLPSDLMSLFTLGNDVYTQSRKLNSAVNSLHSCSISMRQVVVYEN